MDNGIVWKGPTFSGAYYRDKLIFTLTTRYYGEFSFGTFYIETHITELRKIFMGFMTADYAKAYAEKFFLENREFIDKLLDGEEIYGRD